MALTPFGRSNSVWDPFPVFGRWHPFDWLDNSPERAFALDARAIAGTKVDWVETDTAHVFKADLPGLKKEDIKVQLIEDRTLEISGERNKEVEEKNDTFHRVERSHGKFLRRFQLPDNVKVDEVSAKSENGVLTVTVPKILEEDKQTKSISIS